MNFDEFVLLFDEFVLLSFLQGERRKWFAKSLLKKKNYHNYQ